MVIDLAKLTGGHVRNLCGPGQGLKGRDILRLDEADLAKDDHPHKVIAPDNLLVISTRFVAELFGRSVRRVRTRAAFEEIYDLSELDEELREQIVAGIDSVIARAHSARSATDDAVARA